MSLCLRWSNLAIGNTGVMKFDPERNDLTDLISCLLVCKYNVLIKYDSVEKCGS